MSSLQKVIAIDGPSGSGKSTMAKKLAESLSLIYINTGSMFRGISLALKMNSIDLENELELKKWLTNLDFRYGQSEDELIIINNINLTDKIYHHEVSELSSRVSQIPSVRSYLLDFQRKLVKESVCVMEGRDIGSVVFPHAFCKIFFTASAEVRSKRRFDELNQVSGSKITLNEVFEDVKERDQRDFNRSVAPLVQASDAVLFDTSLMTQDEVLTGLVEIVRKRANDCHIDL